jgi:hypothetical protein
MHRLVAALGAACCLLGGAASRPVRAQTATTRVWNDERTRALVARAIELRERQLADTGLTDYQATAQGYLTFLAQVGEGLTEPPRILKADQLALEVYWKAPDLSKQRIVGRRDTLLLPTDISYHRDHLGIVQNNFPDVIRLGDGDEVRDVPHPLSRAGLAAYDYQISDSLRLAFVGRAINVYQVKVRPRDDRLPRVIGAVFLDRETAQVVRMAFNFTRAAFLDKHLEDLAIVLENGLVETRFWLPRRQEIEIQRTGTWMDYPVRGIIRGRWEIAGYQVNRGLPATLFRGPEIVQAPLREQRQHQWRGQILDSLPPDVRAVTDADVQRVQAEARALVRAQALRRARGTTLAARGVSDFARVNRVEGFAVGAGVSRQAGAGLALSARARYGFEDERLKGEVAVAWQRVATRGIRLFARQDFRDVGDEPEVSPLRNTIAAQEFGSDHTDPYLVRAVGVDALLGSALGFSWRLEGALEEHDTLTVGAAPARGRYEGTLGVLPLRAGRLSLRLDRPTALAAFGTELRVTAELRATAFRPKSRAVVDPIGPRTELVPRAAVVAHLERPVSRTRVVSHSILAATLVAPGGTAGLPTQELVFFGGPTTAPGHEFHELVGTGGLSQRLEWQLPIPFVAVPLGRFGRAPARATLAPFAHVAVVGGDPDPVHRLGADGSFPTPRHSGAYPSAGVGLITLFDLLRFDVARGLRDGRWTFSVDVTREFWRIL